MSNPVCEICQKEIVTGQRFVAVREDGNWRVQHDACVVINSPESDLPRFVMNSARAWVLTKKNG